MASHQSRVARLEPRTQAFIDALTKAGGPPIYTLSPAEAREVLRKAQHDNEPLLPAAVEDRTIPGGDLGDISVRIYRPEDVRDELPVVVYIHGGGWVLGDQDTHDRLMRDLVDGAEVAVVFVNYSPSPEAKFPTAIEQSYSVAQWVAEHGKECRLDSSRLAVAGDSVGGNMAAAVTLLAKERGEPTIAFQLLFYPVTDADFDNESYNQFADGPWLTKEAMKWFWGQYLPNEADRVQPLASPLRATLDQLKGLPPALIITDENDVLRDEGEAYAHKLEEAGVHVTAVRYLGTIHDFVMLNSLAETPATLAALRQATESLNDALNSDL